MHQMETECTIWGSLSQTLSAEKMKWAWSPTEVYRKIHLLQRSNTGYINHSPRQVSSSGQVADTINFMLFFWYILLFIYFVYFVSLCVCVFSLWVEEATRIWTGKEVWKTSQDIGMVMNMVKIVKNIKKLKSP